MRLLALTICLLLMATTLAGCGALAERGAAIEGRVAEAAEWAICNGISVAEYRRRFGSDPERAAAYAALCPGGGLMPTTMPAAADALAPFFDP